MCGINGIFRFDGQPVQKSTLALMNHALRHRGPDGSGFYTDGSVGLAMQRLSIIDLAGGSQPISNEDQSLWIVFNGEIYNYRELRKELVGRGHRFKSESDTEVILHLFEEEQAGCLTKLNGIFAFAIWDCKTQRLFVARDRLGVKPLFYLFSDTGFWFSSELKSLLPVIPGPVEVDHFALLLYLLLMYVPTPRSMIKGVCKLEPGCYLWLSRKEGMRREQYWDVEEVATRKDADFCACREELEWLIDDAVRLQARSDVPIGTFLSGGLDSSGLVAFLSRHVPGPMHTYSVGYQGHHYNELPLARKVANRYGTRHQELLISAHDVVEHLPRVAWLLDEPMYDSAIMPTLLLSDMARRDGVKVVLNGTGGDELFGGYDRYLPPRLPRRIFNRMPDGMKKQVSQLLRRAGRPLWMRFHDQMFDYLAGIAGEPSFFKEVIRLPDWEEKVLAELTGVMGEYYSKNSAASRADNLMYFDLKTYLRDDLLFLLDKMTMGASVEGRVPFLDHRIVEFMMRLPLEFKMRPGQNKLLYRSVVAPYLPAVILAAPKRGFGGPLQHWMHEALMQRFNDDEVFQILAGFADLFDAKAIRSRLSDAGFVRRNFHSLFALYLFTVWHKQVLGNGLIPKAGIDI